MRVHKTDISRDRCRRASTAAGRVALLVVGFVALGLTVVGAILPVMPATPFVLLAAYCFARSSRRCHQWLTENRLFGRYVLHMLEGRPLSGLAKAGLIASCWATAIVSAAFLAPNLAVGLGSLGIALGMTAFLLLRSGRGRSSPT